MPFGFDPRKLVEETKKKEKENEEGVVWEAIAKDIDAEEKEKSLRYQLHCSAINLFFFVFFSIFIPSSTRK